MAITKSAREKIEDAFFDMGFDDQGRLLESLHTLHRMKQRQPDQTQPVRRSHRFGSSTVCSVCLLEGAQAIPGRCPGKMGAGQQEPLGIEARTVEPKKDAGAGAASGQGSLISEPQNG